MMFAWWLVSGLCSSAAGQEHDVPCAVPAGTVATSATARSLCTACLQRIAGDSEPRAYQSATWIEPCGTSGDRARIRCENQMYHGSVVVGKGTYTGTVVWRFMCPQGEDTPSAIGGEAPRDSPFITLQGTDANILVGWEDEADAAFETMLEAIPEEPDPQPSLASPVPPLVTPAAPLAPPTPTTPPAVSCDVLRVQKERDLQALRRHQANAEAGVAELEEWSRENEQAQRDALRKGIEAAFGAAAKHAEEQVKTARILKQSMDQLQRHGPVGPSSVELLNETLLSIERAERAAREAAVVNTVLTAKKGYELAQKQALLVLALEAQVDEDVRRFVAEPYVQELRLEPAYSDAMSKFVSLAFKSDLLKGFGPAYSLASFVVEYGYSATAWELSRRQIVQRNELSEQWLAGAEALDTQLRKTMASLAECERGAARPP